VNAGGVGGWTVPGKIAYFQNFNSYANNTTTSSGVNGWTIDTSDPIDLAPVAPNVTTSPAPGGSAFTGGQGYFSVQSNRFECNDTNGSLGGTTANMADVVWISPVISLTGFATVQASVDMINTSTGGQVLDGGADADYYQVLYKLNGGALTTFATNGYIQGNGGAPFSVSGNTLTANSGSLAGGGTIQIFVKMSTNQSNEKIAIDNIKVFDPASSITFTDANSATATVSGLPAPAIGAAP
jgi:hypothetical protein